MHSKDKPRLHAGPVAYRFVAQTAAEMFFEQSLICSNRHESARVSRPPELFVNQTIIVRNRDAFCLSSDIVASTAASADHSRALSHAVTDGL